jgi:hypothetical protein
VIRNLPAMVAICGGSIPAALFLDYALLQEGGPGGWFTRTAEEIELATSLSPQAQKTARKGLTEAGLLTEKKEGMPARLYFCVRHEEYLNRLHAWLRASNPYSMVRIPQHREATSIPEGYPGTVYRALLRSPTEQEHIASYELTVAAIQEKCGWSAFETRRAVYEAIKLGLAEVCLTWAEPLPRDVELVHAAQALRDAGLRPSLAAEALRLATPEPATECKHLTPFRYACEDCDREDLEKLVEAEAPKPKRATDDSPVVAQIAVQGGKQYPVRQSLVDQIGRKFPGVDVRWYVERVRQYHNTWIAKRCTYGGVPARIQKFITRDIAEETVRTLPGQSWSAEALPTATAIEVKPRIVLFGEIEKASVDGSAWLVRQDWEKRYPLMPLKWRE